MHHKIASDPERQGLKSLYYHSTSLWVFHGDRETGWEQSSIREITGQWFFHASRRRSDGGHELLCQEDTCTHKGRLIWERWCWNWLLIAHVMLDWQLQSSFNHFNFVSSPRSSCVFFHNALISNCKGSVVESSSHLASSPLGPHLHEITDFKKEFCHGAWCSTFPEMLCFSYRWTAMSVFAWVVVRFDCITLSPFQSLTDVHEWLTFEETAMPTPILMITWHTPARSLIISMCV